MNKKLIVAALLSATPLFASAATNNVGCGLGTMLFDGKSGLAPQVMAFTTNTLFGNQTFGISTGTLGCAKDGVVANPVKVSLFIENNLDRLAQEMSVGEGETLHSLAQLIGVDAAQQATFFRVTKENLATIMPSTQVTAQDVMASLNGVMAANADLAAYARLI